LICLLEVLKELNEAEPEIIIVPGRDGKVVGGLLEADALTVGFNLEI
jgi:hypothetical protein